MNDVWEPIDSGCFAVDSSVPLEEDFDYDCTFLTVSFKTPARRKRCHRENLIKDRVSGTLEEVEKRGCHPWAKQESSKVSEGPQSQSSKQKQPARWNEDRLSRSCNPLTDPDNGKGGPTRCLMDESGTDEDPPQSSATQALRSSVDSRAGEDQLQWWKRSA